MLVKNRYFLFHIQSSKEGSSKLVTFIYVFHYKHLSSPIEVTEIIHVLQVKCF